jgi:hypothetical protein
MATIAYKIRNAEGQPVGVVHIPHYEKWGSGNMFRRPPYAMTQNEKALQRTVTVDSRGAHLIAAVHIANPGSKFYQWRQRVQITNQDGTLVDIADYVLPGGKLNQGATPQRANWGLDRQSERHEWYWSPEAREQAVYKNRVYWSTRGVSIDAKTAERFSLFEDNPNQPTQLIASSGPLGVAATIKKHPVTGVPLAKEINKQVRLKFATALLETNEALQPNGGHTVLRFTWGFYMDYDASATLYPLRRDDEN